MSAVTSKSLSRALHSRCWLRKMRVLHNLQVQIILLSILTLKVFALLDASSLSAVTGALSGVTGGGSGSSPSSSVDNTTHGNKYYESDGNDGDREYFTLEDLPECGLNEYYEFCGSTCLESCKALRYNFTSPGDCEETCEEGCFCKPGFRRHPSTGSCLLESCCPEKDPQVYYPCDNTGESF